MPRRFKSLGACEMDSAAAGSGDTRCPSAWVGALFLDKHYSADTLRNAHGFPGSPDHPNHASEGDTSKVWPTLCSQLNGFGN